MQLVAVKLRERERCHATSARSSTLTKGAPSAIGRRACAKPQSGQQLPASRRSGRQCSRMPAAAAHEHHRTIQRLAEYESRAARRVTDAQQQQAVRQQRRAHPSQHSLLRGVIEVVQHIQDHDGVGRP